MKFRCLAAVLFLAFSSAACDSPTEPDPRVPRAVGPPTSVSVLSCDYGSIVTTCPAQARWGDLYSTRRDVTQTATWVSSDPAVLRVVSPGRLMSGVEGEAHVTVAYNGTQTVGFLRVYSHEPPWWVCKTCEQHIEVRGPANQVLEGVLVEIIGGHMQGRSAMSTRFGSAVFHRDIIHGPITVRGTKAGYREWVGSAILGGRGGNGQPGSENLGHIVMIPVQ
jgi:hypothetical protein